MDSGNGKNFKLVMTENLLSLSDKDLWRLMNEVHAEKGGAYKIIAFRDGRRIPIRRFLDIDNDGVLYIGKANSFIDRVIELKKSISPEYKGSAHICGRRYKSNPNISKLFPFDSLYVETIQSNDPEQLERSLLREYAMRYGEVPPLNAI